jgi:hypothetical protein
MSWKSYKNIRIKCTKKNVIEHVFVVITMAPEEKLPIWQLYTLFSKRGKGKLVSSKKGGINCA